MGPSSAIRGTRTSRRASRTANTTTATHRSVWAAKIESRHVAASAAISPSCARSRKAAVRPGCSVSALDGRLFGKHDRDVVAHRVDALAGAAAQPGPVLHQLHRRLAHRAGEDLQQVRMDGHFRASVTENWTR